MPSIVQSKGIVGTSLAFDSPVTNGNTIIVCVSDSAVGDTITISDGVNTYTADAAIQNAAASRQGRVFRKVNATGGNLTVTVSGTTGTCILQIHEFPAVIAFDQLATGSGSGSPLSSSAVTPGSANELLFGFFFGVVSAVGTFNSGAGWTAALTTVQANDTAAFTEWQFVTSINNYSATATANIGKSGSINWGAQIDTFSMASTATTPTTLGMMGIGI